MSLPQRLARFNRYVTNPVQRPWVGWAPMMGILEHVGRRSGAHVTGVGRWVFGRLPFENALLLTRGEWSG